MSNGSVGCVIFKDTEGNTVTLRDLFAGMIASGLRASLNGQHYPKEMLATLAYADADAMLQVREGKG